MGVDDAFGERLSVYREAVIVAGDLHFRAIDLNWLVSTTMAEFELVGVRA